MLAQAGHGPTGDAAARDDGCAGAAVMAMPGTGEAMPVAEAAFGDEGSSGHGASAPCHFCGAHACVWIAAPETCLARPLVLAPADHAAARGVRPPSTRAESLHRPPRRQS
ncbi:hypothetical protein BV509_18590 [Rhodovulum sulfidophilum]|nr:hypothetical protein BV509_18590 [Rhodovulum sulfidophilum]